MNLTYQEVLELSKLKSKYQNLDSFMAKHKSISFFELDYAFVHELTLFTIEPSYDFEKLEEQVNTIIKTLPAIKYIFSKPFIHLKDERVLLPTEVVQVIDQKTIQHIASHTEFWSDIKDNEIQPKKLMTRIYEDNYGIYENIVFCKTIDEILVFVRSNIRYLEEFLYTNQTIEINLLERVHHLNYFLSLGKLHTGYNRNFEAYYGISVRLLNKLQFILSTIVPRLKHPVYKNNKNRPKQIRVRKTNILSMHREYHQIYKLSKYFQANQIGMNEEFNEFDLSSFPQNYFTFVELLCIFSVGQFGFVCQPEKKITLSRLSLSFFFKDWKIKLSTKKIEKEKGILLEIIKDTTYKIFLFPAIIPCQTDEKIAQIKIVEQLDEYIVCSPLENSSSLWISMTSIESFRRLQQVILRGMIYADLKRTDCPFCRNKLEKLQEDKEEYACLSCRTIIGDTSCPTLGRRYSYTKIAGLKKSSLDKKAILYNRKAEASLYFRNITQIDDDLNIICPHCGKIHFTHNG